MSYFILFYFTFIHAFFKLSKGYFPCILSDSDGFVKFINFLIVYWRRRGCERW